MKRLLSLLLFAVMLAMPALAAEPPSVPDRENLRLASVKAAAMDLESGELLLRKNADWEAPIASITKLMTGLVVMESGQPLDEWLTIHKRHFEPPNNAYSRIRIGSRLKRGDLLRIALMSSENLAAYTLARHYEGGYDAFVKAMNRKADELGMHSTRFVDPSGLSPKNHSTAADLVRLVAAAHEHDKLREYTTTRYFTARFRGPRYNLRYGNTNVLVHRKRWDLELSKTGYLREAGRCLVMVTSIEGRPTALVLMDSFGSRTPIGDAGRIRRWLRTGEGGRVAGAALRYEREKVMQYNQARAD